MGSQGDWSMGSTLHPVARRGKWDQKAQSLTLLRNPGAGLALASHTRQVLPPCHGWSLGLEQRKQAVVMERGGCDPKTML